MEEIKKVEIRRLNETFVEVSIKVFVKIGERLIEDVDKSDNFSTDNSNTGRNFVKNLDIPQNFIAAIFDAWGDTPTVEDPEMPKMPEVKKQ